MKTKLCQVDNGIGRACVFFLKTSFEDFLVVGSLPVNAGSMGSISFSERFHMLWSNRAPGPQLRAPQRSAPRPASPTASPLLQTLALPSRPLGTWRRQSTVLRGPCRVPPDMRSMGHSSPQVLSRRRQAQGRGDSPPRVTGVG